jgi:hypothetical protein
MTVMEGLNKERESSLCLDRKPHSSGTYFSSSALRLKLDIIISKDAGRPWYN